MISNSGRCILNTANANAPLREQEFYEVRLLDRVADGATADRVRLGLAMLVHRAACRPIERCAPHEFLHSSDLPRLGPGK